MSLLAFGWPNWEHVLQIVVLVLGFGFVIFFHELGHFLAAKWVGIRVEQFAVGFGQALFAWRRGIGVRPGNTQKEYQARIDQFLEEHYKDDPQVREKSGPRYHEALADAEKSLGLGETEYRLNWMPLGGYVKMLGQDDLRPDAIADDPRSYTRKPIGARMLVISAGVIMNVILAGIGFMVLFMIGFHVQPAWVGNIAAGSPAQNTNNSQGAHRPLQVGDKILDMDGSKQQDFIELGLNTALAAENTAIPIRVQHLDGSIEQLQITPQPDEMSGGFLAIGVRPPQWLRGPDPRVGGHLDEGSEHLYLSDFRAVLPGETITQINGKDVKPDEYWKLDEALQGSNGEPVKLTVKDASGTVHADRLVQPRFGDEFNHRQISFAGMVPRAAVASIEKESTANGVIMPGDVVVSMSTGGGDSIPDPTPEALREGLSRAGDGKQQVRFTVLRGKQLIALPPVVPNLTVDKEKHRRGLGIGLIYDDMNPVVAGVTKDSPAYAARIPERARLTAIGGKPVRNWFDVQRLLREAKAGEALAIAYKLGDEEYQKKLTLNDEQIFQVTQLRRTHDLTLDDYQIVRIAPNPAVAAYWGVTETRDFILQFYLTLRRMASGSVSPSQLMGPLGIFVGGARFAIRGWDWLLWFLAMISANLAVVNFLPIPIVDGGHFVFLIAEKIKGRPLSARTQMVAQYLGLAFLAGVFLFVTYHDIVRFIWS